MLAAFFAIFFFPATVVVFLVAGFSAENAAVSAIYFTGAGILAGIFVSVLLADANFSGGSRALCEIEGKMKELSNIKNDISAIKSDVENLRRKAEERNDNFGNY